MLQLYKNRRRRFEFLVCSLAATSMYSIIQHDWYNITVSLKLLKLEKQLEDHNEWRHEVEGEGSAMQWDQDKTFEKESFSVFVERLTAIE